MPIIVFLISLILAFYILKNTAILFAYFTILSMPADPSVEGLERSFVIWFWIAGSTFSCILIGIALYSLRSRYRIFYGIIEITASVVFIAVSAYRALDDPKTIADYNPFSPDLEPLLKMLAAIYIFVRGMDNVGEGLAAFPSCEKKWRYLFPRRQDVSSTVVLRILYAVKRKIDRLFMFTP